MMLGLITGLFLLSPATHAKVKIVASSNVPKPDLESITLDLFKEYLKDSVPELDIEVHYAAELGNEREVFEALQIGSIKLACITTGVQVPSLLRWVFLACVISTRALMRPKG